MAQTRKRGHNSRTPATTTTTSTSVPPLSNTNSVEPETPDTSEPEQLQVKKKVTTTTVVTRNARKRAAEDEVDINIPPKRRVVADAVVVKVPPARALKTKARMLNFVFNVTEPTPTPKNKGKGKAQVIATPEPDDDGLISEDELQYDEVCEESNESGSDYEVVPDSEEDETLMITAAIEASHRTARREVQQRLGAGTSSSRTPTTSRVTTRGSKMCIVESDEELHEDSAESDDKSELSELESSDDEPLPKRKAKAKAKPKKEKAKNFAEPLSWVEKAERHRLARLERREAKREERLLAEKLGRRLTWSEKASLAMQKHHPELKDVWGDLEEQVPVITPEKAAQPVGLKVTLLPFQQESLWWMRKQEKTIWRGGMPPQILVSRSMGKTIQMISLFVSDLKRPNLVIAPTVAIMQWRNEINAHTEGMKVLVWHGASRIVNTKELKQYDVVRQLYLVLDSANADYGQVLTSYAVLESCFRKQESGFKRKGHIVKEVSPLHQIKWNRIVLDEAHNIKERSTNTAKACFELDSNHKWCLSGTPLQNRVGELYSMIRFLGGDPFAFYFCKKCPCKSLHWKFSDKRSCDGMYLMMSNARMMPRLNPYFVECGHSPMQHSCLWNNEILTPIQKNGMTGPGKTAFKKLRVLLDRMMLRRTKIQRADDLGLPPRTVVVRRDYFSPEEKELYLSLFSDAKRLFSTYVDSGTVLNNSLVCAKWLATPTWFSAARAMAIRFLPARNLAKPLSVGSAMTSLRTPIQAKCHHIFDRECMKQYLSTAGDINPECPVCHLPLTIDLEGPALELESTSPAARQGIIGRLNLDTWRSSSKIEALVEELSNLRAQDATTKSIVFSQFVNFLDLIAFRLQKAGFQICRLEGTMSPQARDATIQHFMTNVHVTVFLVSLKAGGVALNLTEASRVYLMDSWWNPAVEYRKDT
ncbi:putative DNA repair protein RAD16 [Butyriboletus roseoflavus]|nr:putative DNA repair protein RAD16 [Butyriboletus roseoflavus]